VLKNECTCRLHSSSSCRPRNSQYHKSVDSIRASVLGKEVKTIIASRQPESKVMPCRICFVARMMPIAILSIAQTRDNPRVRAVDKTTLPSTSSWNPVYARPSSEITKSSPVTMGVPTGLLRQTLYNLVNLAVHPLVSVFRDLDLNVVTATHPRSFAFRDLKSSLVVAGWKKT